MTEGQGGESRQPSTHLKSKGEEATGLEYSTGSQGGHFLRGWEDEERFFLELHSWSCEEGEAYKPRAALPIPSPSPPAR